MKEVNEKHLNSIVEEERQFLRAESLQKQLIDLTEELEHSNSSIMSVCRQIVDEFNVENINRNYYL